MNVLRKQRSFVLGRDLTICLALASSLHSWTASIFITIRMTQQQTSSWPLIYSEKIGRAKEKVVGRKIGSPILSRSNPWIKRRIHPTRRFSFPFHWTGLSVAFLKESYVRHRRPRHHQLRSMPTELHPNLSPHVGRQKKTTDEPAKRMLRAAVPIARGRERRGRGIGWPRRR